MIPADNLPFHIRADSREHVQRGIWEGFQRGIREGLRLWVVPPDHGLIRETRVRAARPSGDSLTLTLEGVDDIETAQRLVGRSLLAQAEDCAGFVGEPDDGELPVLGLRVEDESSGFIGTIVGERVGAAQTLWVVEGPFGEVLIPAVDEFIESVDEATVFMRLPQGLVELNR